MVYFLYLLGNVAALSAFKYGIKLPRVPYKIRMLFNEVLSTLNVWVEREDMDSRC